MKFTLPNFIAYVAKCKQKDKKRKLKERPWLQCLSTVIDIVYLKKTNVFSYLLKAEGRVYVAPRNTIVTLCSLYISIP